MVCPTAYDDCHTFWIMMWDWCSKNQHRYWYTRWCNGCEQWNIPVFIKKDISKNNRKAWESHRKETMVLSILTDFIEILRAECISLRVK